MTPEAVRSLQHAANKRLTSHQKKIMSHLRRGGTIRWEICGWIYQQKRVRVETEDALWATGELTNVLKKGKRLSIDLIVHTAFADKYDAPNTRLPHPYTNIPWSPSDIDTDDSNRR